MTDANQIIRDAGAALACLLDQVDQMKDMFPGDEALEAAIQDAEAAEQAAYDFLNPDRREYPAPDQWEYPDPAKRYEDLHREQREDEQAYDKYLADD